MTYPSDIDKECIPLCDAINSVPGIKTISSCCGHGKRPLEVYFQISEKGLSNLPSLLYWFSSCHSHIEGWKISVFTDCAMDGVTFFVESKCVGDKAYAEADEIAKRIMEEEEK